MGRNKGRCYLICSLLALATTVCCIGAYATPLQHLRESEAGVLHLRYMQKAVERNAVCNDGSPGAYYVRNGTGTGQHVWIFHLDGGFWCWDEETCAKRWVNSRSLMSSKDYPSTISVSGLLSSDPSINPDFYNANIVFISYCSSDAWSGTHGSAHGWVFRGQLIIRAALEDTILSAPRAPYVHILFSGCSAGGQGVVNSLPWVTDFLYSSPVGPYIKIMNSIADAGWMMDILPWDKSHPSSGKQFESAIGMWGPSAINPSCISANPGREWMCFVSPYVFPYIHASGTPLLIQTNQYDSFQIPWDCCVPPWANNTIKERAERIRTAFHVSLQNLITGPSAVFSAACFDHCIAVNDKQFTQIKIKGLSLQQALHQWFFNDTQTLLIEDCAGVNCSPGCSNHI